MVILDATIDDAEALLEIYAPYVRDTAISFEYEVPGIEEFSNRITNISSRYPYIKAVDDDGTIMGYAYATSFKSRAAYDWSVETTIYLRSDCRHSGIGEPLYLELEQRLKDMGILNVNACIARPKGDEPHLSDDSFHFHSRLGYSLVGTFHDSGYKFDTWYDMVWMEKMLGNHINGQANPVFK